MLAITAFATLTFGCARSIDVYLGAGRSPGFEDANLLDGAKVPPLLVGLYQLTGKPAWLSRANCGYMATHAEARDNLSSYLVGDPELRISMLPNSGELIPIDRAVDAEWLLAVPYYRDKCAAPADDWALVRLRRWTQRVFVAVDEHTMTLPWREPFEGYNLSAKQRGCIENESHHMLSILCR